MDVKAFARTFWNILSEEQKEMYSQLTPESKKAFVQGVLKHYDRLKLENFSSVHTCNLPKDTL